MQTRKIELLAPARDLACGLAAVDHGADAVYMGGPRFSARAAAGNSLEDVQRLLDYAHQFGARVYVACNTLLTDDELPEAVDLIHRLHQLGTDGVIIQDMGLLECDLPPIALHASTQCNNQTAAKVRFLEDVGFRQVVLARELSLTEIAAIRKKTGVVLECFVHGALCVSYSGQCYISEVMAGRSANRGECAQFCRHAFNLVDGRGQVVEKERYLLSLKDLDHSSQLAALLDAGVDSLKIEGRLKGEDYVKNITAYYRQALDRLLDSRDDLVRSSAGRCGYAFLPDPRRTFHRGATDYYLLKERARPGQLASPKSLGMKLGKVSRVSRDCFELESFEKVVPGDGLCYLDKGGRLVGLLVNRVTDGRIYPHKKVTLTPGVEIYRNHDQHFQRQLKNSNGCRQLSVCLRLVEVADGCLLEVRDEEGVSSSVHMPVAKEVSKTPGRMQELVKRQLCKSGGTCFTVKDIEVAVTDLLHLSSAYLNELRRQALTNHLQVRLASYQPEQHLRQPAATSWPGGEITVLDNILNRQAAAFYRRYGAVVAEDLQQLMPDADRVPLMTTRYCIRMQLGACPKEGDRRLVEPLCLVDKTGSYGLDFDCAACRMRIMGKSSAKR